MPHMGSRRRAGRSKSPSRLLNDKIHKSRPTSACRISISTKTSADCSLPPVYQISHASNPYTPVIHSNQSRFNPTASALPVISPFHAQLRHFASKKISKSSVGLKKSFLEDNRAGTDIDENSFFFDNKPDNGWDMDQRMKVRSQDTQYGLEQVKGFMATDPQSLGMSRGKQLDLASQIVSQMDEQRQFDLMDEAEEDGPQLSPQEQLQVQMKDFEEMPMKDFLSAIGHKHPQRFLEQLKQQDKAQLRFTDKVLSLQDKQRQLQNESNNDDDTFAVIDDYDDDDDGSVRRYDEHMLDDADLTPEQIAARRQQHLEAVGFRRDHYKLGKHGEIELDQETLERDGEYNNLRDDPTVFKYMNDDYEYYIPPGMSIKKLLDMDIPVAEVLNYARKQVLDGQLQTNYYGVDLKQLNTKIQLENVKRRKKGLEPLSIQLHKPTHLADLNLDDLPEADRADLQEYYGHIEHIRKLKQVERMRDNPQYDPDDPDWQDEDIYGDHGGIDQSVEGKRIVKAKKLVQDASVIDKNNPMAMLKKLQSTTATDKSMAASNMFDCENDDTDVDDDNDFILSPEEVAEAERVKKLKNRNKVQLVREPQFPEHKPTIQALRQFVRTVPLDEPLPKELQRRVNLLLGDANYVKHKDLYFMMNDVEIWYLANRLPVVYSIMRRILIEIRQRIPSWKPERVLEFAAGASPGLWAVRDIYYQDIGEYTAVERDGRLALLGQQLTADLGVHIYYRSRLLVDNDGNVAMSQEDEKRREKMRSKLTHKQKKQMDKEDKQRREKLKAELEKKQSLVIAPYALSKQPNKEYRRLLLEALWDQVDPNGGLLMIMESTEADASGFNVVRECRDYLLKKYPKQIQVQEQRVDDEDAVTPLVHVEEKLTNADDFDEGATTLPDWATKATKKVHTKEQEDAGKETAPSASSVLPCSHDKPCPMGAMLKLHNEVNKLKKLAREEQLSISLPQVPIKACMFGQRMLRAPMPNQSPLQDINVPQHLGDAIIENFSYIVLRRGNIPVVQDEDLELTPHEPTLVNKGKLNLPGGLTREDYQELKEFEKNRPQISDDYEQLEDYDLEFEQTEESEDYQVPDHTKDNDLQDIEARRLAMNIFGAKSIDNEESIERYNEKMFDKLKSAQTSLSPKMAEQQRLQAKRMGDSDDEDNNGKKNHKNNKFAKNNEEIVNKYEEINEMLQEDAVPEQNDELDNYDLEIIQKELGYELDAEALDTLRDVIREMERDRPLINPKREFNLNRWSRVLSPPLKRGGHVVVDLCTPDGNFERRNVGREGVGKYGFKQARQTKWGDIWPYKRPMTLKELKAQRSLDQNAKDMQGVSSSLEASEKLKELRTLFSTSYTPESIMTVERFQEKLGDMSGLLGQKPGQQKDFITKPIDLENLTFDDINNVIDLTPQQREQFDLLQETVQQQRYKSEIVDANRQKLATQNEGLPDEYDDKNIFNDPSYYEAIPGFDRELNETDVDGKSIVNINGKVFVNEIDAYQSVKMRMAAHQLSKEIKFMQDSNKNRLEGEKLDIIPDLKILQSLQHLAGLSPDNLTPVGIAAGETGQIDFASAAESFKLDGLSPTQQNLDRLRLQLEQQHMLFHDARGQSDFLAAKEEHQRAMGRKKKEKEFIDDETEYEQETSQKHPEALSMESVNKYPVPNALSKGVRVDDVISSVESRINELKQQKKDRAKLSKKQQKILEKQRQKEAKETTGPQEGDVDAQDIPLINLKDIRAKNSEMAEDFKQLISQNVELDESIWKFEELKKQQKQQQQQKTEMAFDDHSYDEYDDGKSDYSDGEVVRLFQPDKDVIIENPDILGLESAGGDIDITNDVKLDTWQTTVIGDNIQQQKAMKEKFIELLSAQQTEELQQLIDKKNKIKDGKIVDDKHTKSRNQQKAQSKMERTFLFSDDDEWDLNEKDSLFEQKVKKTPEEIEREQQEVEFGQKKNKKEPKSIQGAALDVVDPSYRIMSSKAKERNNIPLTGKRTFADPMYKQPSYDKSNLEDNPLLKNVDKSKRKAYLESPFVGDNDELIHNYIDVTVEKQREKAKNIHGFGKNEPRSSKMGNNTRNRDTGRNKPRNSRSFTTNAIYTNPISLSSSPFTNQRGYFGSVRPLQKQAVLLTMPGQTLPPTSSTKTIQIKTETKILKSQSDKNHYNTAGLASTTAVRKLNPNAQVYRDALDIRSPRQSYSKGSIPSSIFNTILTHNPTHDLNETDEYASYTESSASALSKDNRRQASTIAHHGLFKFDGTMGPMSTAAMKKAQEMAAKIRDLAKRDDDVLSSIRLNDSNSARPLGDSKYTAGTSATGDFETDLAQKDKMKLLNQDIYVSEDLIDHTRQKHGSPQFDAIPGVLYRNFKPKKTIEELQDDMQKNRLDNDFESYARDLMVVSADKAATRYDQFGLPVQGKLNSMDAMSGSTLNHFRSQDTDWRRKQRNKQVRTEFQHRIETGRQILADRTGTNYTPRTNVDKTFNQGKIDLSKANLGKDGDITTEKISSIQEEIDNVIRLRRERQKKMLTPLSLQDDIQRDPEGKAMDTVKIKPSVYAKTQSEKRASLAVIEADEESEVRQFREQQGLDYSHTALLTNQDGFGPKMDKDGKFIEKIVVTPFKDDIVTLEELNGLIDFAEDSEREELQRTYTSAKRYLATNQEIQENHFDLIQTGQLQKIPFKLKLNRRELSIAEQHDIDGLRKMISSGGDHHRAKSELSTLQRKAEKFSYDIRPISKDELAVFNKQFEAPEIPDVRKDIESLLIKHKTGLTLQQRQGLVAEDQQQSMKLSLATTQLSSLARRFTELAQKQEDRDLLAGSDADDLMNVFEPPQVPSMQDAWNVKNRHLVTPERHKASVVATNEFVRKQRKYDKVIAELQEADLLERLAGGSLKIPASLRNDETQKPFSEDFYQQNKLELISKGIKTQQQIELEELHEALDFEKDMQKALHDTYGVAKQQLKKKLRTMAAEEGIGPNQFKLGVTQGLMLSQGKDELTRRLAGKNNDPTEAQLVANDKTTFKLKLNGNNQIPPNRKERRGIEAAGMRNKGRVAQIVGEDELYGQFNEIGKKH